MKNKYFRFETNTIMVNYCCVFGCGRNSRSSKHLYFYGAPKELHRQERWLEAAGRADILNKPPEKRITYRFCSRHFSPVSFKNKHLCPDAVPTLCLPGSAIEEPMEETNEKKVHPNISCDNCGNSVVGFRYKCITCLDYDLCSRCELNETHSKHLMLRIPVPVKYKKIDNMIKKWQEYSRDSDNDDSSDDEPITKYSKNYDSGVDLSEDVKETIRKEVTRVLTQKASDTKRNKKVLSRKRPSETDKLSKIQKIETVDLTALFSKVFADVDAEIPSVGSSQMNVKNESLVPFDKNTEPPLPMLEIKLGEDLSELMMEVVREPKLIN